MYHSPPLKSFSRFLIFLLVVQLSIGLFAFPMNLAQAAGTTYYVSNCGVVGNDSNNGTSSSTPWLTIAKVNSSTFNHGDSILFNSGCTWREQLSIPSSGTSGSPITFGAYGSGAKPIINGSNIVTGWAASSNITGSVTQANMKLSTVNGAAFVDFNGTGGVTLSSYIGDDITVCSATNPTQCVSGYIKTAGTGETYGSQLLGDPTLANNGYLSGGGSYTTLSSGCHSSSCLQVTLSSSYNAAAQYFAVSSGMLLQNSVYMKKGTDAGQQLFMQNEAGTKIANTAFVAPVSWAQYVFYATADSTAGSGDFDQGYGGENSGDTDLWDTASVVQVKTPSTTGVTIVSSSGGSSYNWTSNGFSSNGSYNDSAGYTFTVSVPNVWQVSMGTQPYDGQGVVIVNGVRGTYQTSMGALTSNGDWYWANDNIYLYETSNPSGVEVGTRNAAIQMIAKNYITVENLELYGAVAADLYAQNSNNLSILDNTIINTGNSFAFDGGNDASSILLNGSSNSLIQGNSITYGYQGIQISGYGSGTNSTNDIKGNIVGYMDYEGIILSNYGGTGPIDNTIENNQVSYCAQNKNDAGGIYTYGAGAGNVIRYNLSYNNGTANMQAEGIEVDTYSATTTIYGNIAYGNTDGGIDLTGSGHLVYNNTLYNNDTQSWNAGELNFYNVTNCMGMTVENNIAYASPGKSAIVIAPECETGQTINNNLYYGSAASPFDWGYTNYNFVGWKQNSGQDANSLNANPLFTDLSGSYSTSTDFTLQSSSPAIDAGLNLGTSYDMGLDPASTWPSSIILDNQNSFGAGWEMGAYVYTQTSTPSVSITAPTASSTVSGTISVTATSSAVSPASISSVQFYLDGSPLGSAVTSSPYTISWNTGTATNTSHTLYALATDNYSNTATSTSITVTVSNQAVLSVPTSTLNFSAAHGSTATSTQSVVVTNAGATSTTLNWSASSTQSWLTFSPASGSLSGNATTSASFIVNPATLALGTYNATATIADSAASSSPQYIPVSFTINTTGIGTTLLSPTGGTIATGTISVTATATSTVGISSVQFYLDSSSTLLGTVTSSPYTISWDTTMASDGSHTLYSEATDNNSNIASSSEITITVDNTPPAVSITSPTSGATVSGATSIAASSSDAISGVSSVAFYLDGSLLGESTSSPYSINWDTTQTNNASHNITAIAVDGAGNATTSQAISVTVYNAPSVSSGGGGGGGVPQSAFIVVSTATSTASSTASSSPLLVSTSTTPSTAITTSSLQAELNILLAELQSLEAQAGNTTTTVTFSPYAFTTDLQLWDTGPAVTDLQRYLISEVTGPAATKLKAHGVTQTFGMLTYNALAEFQAFVGIHATGYFGPITRGWVNGHE